jgi:hypothetical protein
MFETLFISVLIVAICIALLSVGIIVKGRFPSTHVCGNKAMRERGIHSAQQQDREARQVNPHAIAEVQKGSVPVIGN